MRPKYLTITLIITTVFQFIAVGIHAGTTSQDVIKMETTVYSSRTKGIVTFNHKHHQTDYKQKFPELYKAECGECHHDQSHKLLVNLKAGDNVQKCIECHKKPGFMQGKKAKGLSDEQKREYHANALHDNCKSCHKTVNKKTGKKAAPGTCKSCHGE